MATATVHILGNGPYPGYDAPLPEEKPVTLPDIRECMACAYDVGKWYYVEGKFGDSIYNTPDRKRSASAQLRDLGALIWYGHQRKCGGRKRTAMDVESLVDKWHYAVVELALAHDKDEADRVEASIEECLMPILSAPIKQVREFAGKLMERLKSDPKVPFLVWRGFERYVETVIAAAPDGEIKRLKTEAATAIADLVEDDLKPQLHTALVRALQWRSPEKLEEVKQVVAEEKAKGNKPRLRGRESCLFLEAGGTEDQPQVCVQI